MSPINKEIFLSIITITKNNHNGITKTIKSVSGQTNHNFEHIIIDNLSQDATNEEVNKYILNKPKSLKIKYIRELDKGISDAMNKGLISSKGSHILFLNSGDVLISQNTIDKIYQFIYSNPKKKLYLFGVLIEINQKRVPKINIPINIFTMFISNFIHHQGAIYNKEFIISNNHEFDMRFPFIGCDYYFNLKLVTFKNISKVDYRNSLNITIMDGKGISYNNPTKVFSVQHKIRLYIFGKKYYLPSILIRFIMQYKLYKFLNLFKL